MKNAIENGSQYSGLTKREQFAAMAMQGLCASGLKGILLDPRLIAADAVNIADQLLKALER